MMIKIHSRACDGIQKAPKDLTSCLIHIYYSSSFVCLAMELISLELSVMFEVRCSSDPISMMYRLETKPRSPGFARLDSHKQIFQENH